MDYISQQDLDVRMQLTGCKFSQLTNEFADNLKYGRKCIVENQRNLVLLNAYLELLECYKVARIIKEQLSTGSITLSYDISATISLSIGDLLITSPMTIDNSEEIDDIVNLFNTNQSEIVASSDNGNNNFTLNFSGPCTNATVDVLYTTIKDSITYPVAVEGGVCASTTVYKNCITEEQLALMLDKISKLINICFQPYDFTYTDLHT
jgi:hypothetical protein